MKLFLLLIVIFLLAGCAPAAELPGVVTITPEFLAPVVAETEPLSTQRLPEPSRTLEPASPTAVSSMTPFPTFTEAPTETPLPTLDLPTENPRVLGFLSWTGLPTYPGDSEQRRFFEVLYDPEKWAQTDGNFGEVVLANRLLTGCQLTSWAGRGLPPGARVEQDFKEIKGHIFDISIVRVAEQVQFYTYTGGDSNMITGFQLIPGESMDLCVQEAEVVFASIRSFTGFSTATPRATP